MAASGSGKGVWLKDQLRKLKPRRLVIFDFKNEYGEFAQLVPSLSAVRAAMLKAGARGALAIRYRPQSFADKPMKREFEALCSLVQAWESCTFLVEELSNFTTPSWAPPAWRMMTTGGRHEGIHIIGVAQQPALIDKTFLSNCTLIHVGSLHEHAHRQAVERSMDIEPGSLADLVQYQWIEKDRKTGEFRVGVVRCEWATPPAAPTVPRRRSRGGASAGRAPVEVPTVGATVPKGAARRTPRLHQSRNR